MTHLQPETIKSLRKSRNLTQEQLGMLSGMSKSQISRMENGLLGSEETTGRLLTALGYSLEITIRDNYASPASERDRVLNILRMFKKYNSLRYGIESIALFGSFARGEQRDDSDVDILISFKKPSLYLYAEISDLMKSLLKRDVDLISATSSLNPGFRDEIEKDLIYVR